MNIMTEEGKKIREKNKIIILDCIINININIYK